MRSSRRGVAQPGSALAWGARGREFESRRPDHAEPMWLVVFSKQIESVSTVFAALAQLVEHLTCNQGVVSSNPTGGTNKIKGLAEMLAPCCFCLVSQW